MSTARRAGALALALALILVGGGLGAHQHWKVTNYEQTTATIDSATMDVHIDHDQNSGNDREYAPQIHYNYLVGDERYENDDISVGLDMSTERRNEAANVLARFDNGSTTTVYYDPAEPDKSFLVPRYEFLPGGLLFALGMLVLGDALTPRTRVIQSVFSRVPVLGSTDSAPTVPDQQETVPNDPTAILDDSTEQESQTQQDTDALVTGRLVAPVWIGCGLAVLASVGLFVLVSKPPHPISAVLVGVGASIAVGRWAYLRILP